MSKMEIAQVYNNIKNLKQVIKRLDKYSECKEVKEKYDELFKAIEKIRYSL